MTSTMNIGQIWAQGDAVTQTVAVILLAMSVMSWTVFALKAKQLFLLKHRPDSPRFSQGFFSDLNQKGQEAATALLSMNQRGSVLTVDSTDWMSRHLRASVDKSQHHLQTGLGVLASIGATAPFIGLFGTVWGIYQALAAIGVNGQPSIGQIAGPIGEALIMTALGLFVAIPAVLAYNSLVRAVRGAVANLQAYAHSQLAFHLTGQALAEAK